jgi:LCP family protein required for cell wall assembly
VQTNPDEILRSRTKRRRSRWRLWHTFVLLVLAFLAAGILYAGTIVDQVVQEIHTPLSPEVAVELRPSPVRLGEPVNILLMGLDDERLRTDTLMLLSVDTDSKRVTVLQIPRDTRTQVAGRNSFDKVNAAYAYGVGDKRFPANLRALRTAQELLGIKVHYTVTVDLDGFRYAVNEIGGVWVDIPQVMDYDDPTQNLHIHFQPGRQKLDGEQALEFVRWRNNNDGTGYPDGDLGRIRTQQQFLRTVMDELVKPANLPFLPNLVVKVARYVESTIEPSRLTSLAKLAVSIGKADVTMLTLPGVDASLFEPDQDRYIAYYLPDPDGIRKIVDRQIHGIDPQQTSAVRVAVVQTPGNRQAETVSLRMASQGFKVELTQQDGPKLTKARIVDLRGDASKTQLVARSLMAQGYDVEVITQVDPKAAVDLQVWLGPQVPSSR